jgi:sec-independent protein translocase protein TatA
MFGLGTTELILILVIVLIIFGAGKLPEIGSAMGKAIKSFKKTVSETESEIDITPKEEEKEKIEAGTKEAEKAEKTEEKKEQVS